MGNDQSRQRAYWDSNLDTRNLSEPAAPSSSLNEEILFLRSPEYRYALDRLGPLRESRILEIGCGMGVSALYMAEEGGRIWAMDLSLERLKALSRWAASEGLSHRICLVQGAIEKAPFRDAVFDGAFTKSVLIHTDLDGAANEIARTLKAEGIGVFIEPTRFNPLVGIYRKFFAPAIWKSIAHYFDDEAWRRFARPFARLETRPFFFLSFLSFYWQYSRRDARRFQRSVTRWHRFDRFLFNLIPPLRRMRWMDVAVAWKQPPAKGMKKVTM